MKEALFYKKLADYKVQCTLCPWNCTIVPEKVGTCGVRQNINGKLYSLIYKKVSSLAVDPIEKKPLYHFHPGIEILSVGTFGCNFHCGHCQNWQISRVSDDRLRGVLSLFKDYELIEPGKLIQIAKARGCPAIAWTYNEPTIWFEYALEAAKLAKEAGLYTVFVTNGYINPEPLDMLAPYIDAYSLDVKGFADKFYQKVVKIKDWQPVLRAAERIKNKWHKHLEIVTLVIPSLNDDEEQLRGLAKWMVEKLGPETPWHVTRFFPYLDYQHLAPTPIETLERAKEIGLEAGLKLIHIGNVPGYF